jgi:hypothetical protein
MNSRGENILALATALCWFTCVATLAWPVLGLAQSPQEGPRPAPAVRATHPPQTIDDLIVSIRNHLDDDFLCWKAEKIESYWDIPVHPRAGTSFKAHGAKGAPVMSGERENSLKKYWISARNFQRNGEMYKGVQILFNATRKSYENPEISYLRLFEIFGNPTVSIHINSEIAPPPPGEKPVEIKREGKFQEQHLEWERIAPNVLVMANTGFRSEIHSLMAVKNVSRGCD